MKVYLSYESYNKEEGIKNTILWTSSFFTELISFPAFFLSCVAISHSHNNEYIIIPGLTRGLTAGVQKC